MKYKISVNLNRITIDWQTAFNKAKAYHLKHGVDIQFIFHQIDVHGYTSYWNDFKKRWLIQGAENLVTIDPTADANIFVFNEAEWATPAGSQFPLRLDTPNGSCMAINGKPFINIGTYDKEDQAIDWVEITHEICHALVQTANMKGYLIQDVMDITPVEVDCITGQPI